MAEPSENESVLSRNATKPLNILLITSDQQHYAAIGAHTPGLKTPNLDRLCREGTRFGRAYCNSPVCSPSRATMITGQYPSWHGCWTIGVKLPEDVPTVGDRFREKGYDTSLIGKAHFQPLASTQECHSVECQPILRDLDYWRGFTGPWYGFDHVELTRNHADESHVGQHYAIWMEEKGLKNWQDYFRPWPEEAGDRAEYWKGSRQHTWDLPPEYHYTTWTAERTIARIEHCHAENKPFFCWSSFHDPHPPYLVPEPWASMYDPADMQPGTAYDGELDHLPAHFAKVREDQPDFAEYRDSPHPSHGFHSHNKDREALQKDMAVYYGMISFMDQQIGRILDRLDRLGLADNTLIVFTTDHGHFLGQHGLIAKGPFHYEDMLRLPFIVRWPGHVPAGRVDDASLQSLIDLPSTFLSAAGLRVPGQMQGVDQTPVWRGEAASAREAVIVENRHQPTKVDARSLITSRHKLTVYRDRPYGELFDLVKDPHETRNRWSDPACAATKTELLHAFVNEEMRREPTRYPRIAGA